MSMAVKCACHVLVDVKVDVSLVKADGLLITEDVELLVLIMERPVELRGWNAVQRVEYQHKGGAADKTGCRVVSYKAIRTRYM